MNTNDPYRVYTDAVTAQLGERVTNLGRRQTDMESEMRAGFKQTESAASALAAEFRNSIASLSTSLAERNRPQWAAIAVAISFCTVIGGVLAYPVMSATGDLKITVSSISDKMVTQAEMKWRTDRGLEDRARTDAAIKDIRDALVPSQELERVWQSEDQQHAQMQKQIDELKQGQANTYSARDLLLDMRERQDRLERQLYSTRPPPQ